MDKFGQQQPTTINNSNESIYVHELIELNEWQWTWLVKNCPKLSKNTVN